MLRIVLRNLLRRKSRTALSMIGIVMGVMTIVALISVSDGLQREADVSLGVFQSITVIKKDAIDPVFSTLPKDYANELSRVQGVSMVSGEIYGFISQIDSEPLEGFNQFLSFVIGVDVPTHTLLRRSYFSYITEGRALTNSDRYSCVIGKGLADDFNKNVGDKIRVDDTDFRVVGIYEFESRFFDSAIIVPIEVAREFGGFSSDEVSVFSVETENPEDSAKTALRIEMRLDDVDAQTQQEFSAQAGQFLGTVRTVQLIVSGIAAFVGGIGVLNTMLTTVSERTKEIGIMKAVGWTDWDVMKGIIMESMMIGLSGGIIGILVGVVISFGISEFIRFGTYISLDLAIYALSFALILGLFGGIYPARKAAKLSPIDALRFE